MTTKGQMKPTFRVSLTASQVGGKLLREHPKKCPQTYDRVQYSNRPDLQKKSQKKNTLSGPPWNLQSRRTRAMRFKIQNRHKTIINFNINFQSWILRIKGKLIVPIHKVHRSKNAAVEKFMNPTASNSKIGSTLTRMIPLTNRSNHEPTNTIQLQNLFENQIMKEPSLRISVARVENIF